jgi:hypothetical protein
MRAEELDGGKEIVDTSVVSRGDPSGIPEFSNEAFDEVTVAVQEGAEGETLPPRPFGGDVGNAPTSAASS